MRVRGVDYGHLRKFKFGGARRLPYLGVRCRTVNREFGSPIPQNGMPSFSMVRVPPSIPWGNQGSPYPPTLGEIRLPLRLRLTRLLRIYAWNDLPSHTLQISYKIALTTDVGDGTKWSTPRDPNSLDGISDWNPLYGIGIPFIPFDMQTLQFLSKFGQQFCVDRIERIQPTRKASMRWEGSE